MVLVISLIPRSYKVSWTFICAYAHCYTLTFLVVIYVQYRNRRDPIRASFKFKRQLWSKGYHARFLVFNNPFVETLLAVFIQTNNTYQTDEIDFTNNYLSFEHIFLMLQMQEPRRLSNWWNRSPTSILIFWGHQPDFVQYSEVNQETENLLTGIFFMIMLI